jgi:hypothetical protein
MVELASFIAAKNKGDFTNDNLQDLQDIVCQLIFATTKTTFNSYGDETGYGLVPSMLINFAVGTDRRKKLPNLPSDRGQLKALRILDRRSSV